jgi:hypothetical protein
MDRAVGMDMGVIVGVEGIALDAGFTGTATANRTHRLVSNSRTWDSDFAKSQISNPILIRSLFP